MEIFNKQFLRLKENGALLVAYALLAEGLCLGYLIFIGLFTLETLLPTFVTAHLSLTKLSFVLFLGSFMLILLGRFLNLRFLFLPRTKNPLLIIGVVWAIGILTFSLYKFPLMAILLITLGFLLTGFLFWKILFDGEKNE